VNSGKGRTARERQGGLDKNKNKKTKIKIKK
jgi:hypothetical protein